MPETENSPLAALLVHISALAREVGEIKATAIKTSQIEIVVRDMAEIKSLFEARNAAALERDRALIERLDGIEDRLNRGDAKFDAIEAARAIQREAAANASGETAGMKKTLALIGALTMSSLTLIGGLVYNYWHIILAFLKIIPGKGGPT